MDLMGLEWVWVCRRTTQLMFRLLHYNMRTWGCTERAFMMPWQGLPFGLSSTHITLWMFREPDVRDRMIYTRHELGEGPYR